MLFADGYDSLFLQPPAEIRATYDDLAARARPSSTEHATGGIVFSAECNNAPICLPGYPASATPLRFVNTGNYMGSKAAIAALLEDTLAVLSNAVDTCPTHCVGVDTKSTRSGRPTQPTACMNDQYAIARLYVAARADPALMAKYNMTLDHDARLFLSAWKCPDFPNPCGGLTEPFDPMSKTRVINQSLRVSVGHGAEGIKATPAIVHFNGGRMKGRQLTFIEQRGLRQAYSLSTFPVYVDGVGFRTFAQLGCNTSGYNNDELYSPPQLPADMHERMATTVVRHAEELIAAESGPMGGVTRGGRYRAAVLFKVHQLDDATLDALRQLVRDLRTVRDEYDLFLVYDRRGVSDEEAEEVVRKARHGSESHVRTFGFVAEELHALYPTQYKRSNVNGWRIPRMAHDNPEYAYLLWWRRIGSSPASMPASTTQLHEFTSRKRTYAYDHLWGIEYDVRFSGNWAVLFNGLKDFHSDRTPQSRRTTHSAGSKSGNVDLLANEIEGIGNQHLLKRRNSQSTMPAWPFVDRIVDSLLPYRTHVYMPIVRYSARMLDLMHRSYSDGLVGYCEIAQASICNMTVGCRMANIPHEWVSVFKYSPAITPKDYKLLAQSMPNKLWHPVKLARPLTGKAMDESWEASTFVYKPPPPHDPLASTASSLDWEGCLLGGVDAGVAESPASGSLVRANTSKSMARSKRRFGKQVRRPWLERVDAG